MTPKRKRRLLFSAAIVSAMTLATALFVTAFEKNLMYFYSPSEVAAGVAPPQRKFRVGGLVVGGSVNRKLDSLAVEFKITDKVNEITVSYEGILPDLFREGQGIIAHGRRGNDGVFKASEVLAKHDENYMPPEVASVLAETKSGG